MISVEKFGDNSYPNIRISNGVNSFVIARNGFPDPVWHPEINAFTSEEDITFKLTEDDGDIYILFCNLYQNIIDGNVYPLEDSDLKNKTPNEIRKLKRDNAKEKARYKTVAEKSGLVTDGVINYHSEDYDAYDFASILTIKKIDNDIEIVFSRNKHNPDENFPRTFPTYHVRITEVGGIYNDYFRPFIAIHRQLQSINWDEPNLPSDQINLGLNRVLSKN